MYTKQLSTFRIKTMVISYDYLTQCNSFTPINVYDLSFNAHVCRIVHRKKYISEFTVKNIADVTITS